MLGYPFLRIAAIRCRKFAFVLGNCYAFTSLVLIILPLLQTSYWEVLDEMNIVELA